MANKIQVRRGTKAQITAAGPFAAGEPVYALDTRELVIGNGTGANTPVVTATSADITYYVRTDGNDANTGLANTAGGAFKTIGKAVSMVPQVVNHAVVVNVAAGTYNEVVTIAGRSGSSTIQINGDSVISTSRSVHSFFITNCACYVEVNGFTGTRTDGEAFSVKASTRVMFYRNSVTSAGPSAVGYFVEASSLYMNECQASNRLVGIYAHVNGQIFASGITGSGCSIGYQASVNGRITVQNSTLTAAGILTDTVFGGTIHTKGGVINPWGDNNYNDRTFIEVSSNAAQSIPVGVNTKLLFNLKSFDTLFEYGGSTGRFTATKSGHYTVVAALLAQGFATNAELDFYVFINGGSGKTFRHVFRTNLESVSLPYVIPLNAGDYFELYLIASSSGFIGNGTADRTTLTIQREA